MEQKREKMQWWTLIITIGSVILASYLSTTITISNTSAKNNTEIETLKEENNDIYMKLYSLEREKVTKDDFNSLKLEIKTDFTEFIKDNKSEHKEIMLKLDKRR